MAFKRIKDWVTSITSFRTGDVIPVDGPSGTAKMSKDALLQETAQNALAGNVAPAFDPTRTSANPYKAGESVVYEGKVYTFKVNHYGAWDASDVYADNAINVATRKSAYCDEYYSILKNSLNVYIDDSFNVATGYLWKSSVISVPVNVNVIELNNPSSNVYAYRVLFLTSDNLVIGNPAPVVYNIKYQIDAGNRAKLAIPYNCTHVFVYVYTDIQITYKFVKDETLVPIFKINNFGILNDGTIGAKNDYILHVIETKNLNCKFVRLANITNNRFDSAYCTDNAIASGSITLYADSEIGVNFAPPKDDTIVDIPIPPGVNFILLSVYKTASFVASKSNEKTKCEQSIYFKEVKSDNKLQNVDVAATYGDDIVFRATSTYDAMIADIRVRIRTLNGSYTNIAYMAYGRLYYNVKSPLSSWYSVAFGSGDPNSNLPIMYMIEAGPIIAYEESKFTIAYLNAGCFDNGKSTGPTKPPSDGPAFVTAWISLLKEIDPDVIMFCEWQTKMTTGDDYQSKRKLLNNYPCVQEYTKDGGYTRNAIASRFDTTKYTTILYTNQISENAKRNFSFVKINLFGKDICCVITHLELSVAVRALQIAELITYFENENYVIIGGDFNCSDITEYQPLTEAGYDMANGDMWGVVYTYIGNSVSPAADVPADNIVVKGIKLKNPRFPYNIEATDHKASVADVYLI